MSVRQIQQARFDVRRFVDTAPMASSLRRTRLSERATRAALAHRLRFLQPAHRLAALRWRYHFFAITSFISSCSKLRFAYIRFSRAFSCSSSRNRCMSDTLIPPYFDRHW
jgi:hypothetical protein